LSSRKEKQQPWNQTYAKNYQPLFKAKSCRFYPLSKTSRAKNPTLTSGMSPYRKYMGVPPPPILGNPGVFFSSAHSSLSKENPWERSLLELVPEVDIQRFADWSTP